jgi:hypothetical protein
MPTLRESQRPCSMPGLQPIDQAGARPRHLQEKCPLSAARYVARQLRQVGRQAQTVQIIPQQLFCFRHRVPPRVAKGKRCTASGVLSVVYATRKQRGVRAPSLRRDRSFESANGDLACEVSAATPRRDASSKRGRRCFRSRRKSGKRKCANRNRTYPAQGVRDHRSLAVRAKRALASSFATEKRGNGTIEHNASLSWARAQTLSHE